MGKHLTSPRPGEPTIKGGMLAAWRRGFDAAQAGKRLKDNPYENSAGGWGEAHRIKWREGWEIGRITPREVTIAQAQRCQHCQDFAIPGTKNCKRHQGWKFNQKSDIPVRERERRRRAELDKTPCATCSKPFRALNHNSKFCDYDHDPSTLLLDERLALARQYPGCEERWAKKYREMVRRNM